MREGLDRDLTRWRDAGLIDAAQADAIADHERARGEDERSPVAAPAAASSRDRRTRVAEAVGYVGAALAVGAVVLLLGEVWDRLLVGGRLTLLGLVTCLLGGAGWAIRSDARRPVQRLAGVLLTAAVAGVGWSAAVVADDLAGLGDDDVFLVVSLAVTAAAAAVYALHRAVLPQLALLAGVALTAGALLARPALPPGAAWGALVVWAVGVAWLLLGAGGWLRPRVSAEVGGGVLALLAVQVGAFDLSGQSWPVLLLGTVTAAGLVGIAVATDRGHHLAVGAVGLFVLLPQLAFALFGQAIGAPATLLVVGLLLVVLAVGLTRVRREVSSSTTEVRS